MTENPSMRERMLAGELYIADDPVLAEQSARTRGLIHRFNTSDPTGATTLRAILTELLAAFGEGSEIRPPFYCDYGYQTSIGARCFLNWGVGVAGRGGGGDCDDVQIGRTFICCRPLHPINPHAPRQVGAAEPIVDHGNVWLGGGVIVGPGVTIGTNTVVGAGGL